MKPRPKRKDEAASHEKKRQRFVFWGSLFMVALMVFSFAEIIINRGTSSTGQQTSYGKYEFALTPLDQGQVWTTSINGQEVQFQNLPVQAVDIAVDPSAIEILKASQQIVLTADMNQSLSNAATIDYAKLELSLAIPKTISAMATEDERYKLPVIDCSRASATTPVVLFNVTNDTSVRVYGNCIVVNAEQADILRVKDRIIFEYYDILKNGQVQG